ncbi:MAG: MFS transporter [Alphaproteobacteria bacterium]|nr:MFS transporter [Alphaproteobacteria bacterium]
MADTATDEIPLRVQNAVYASGYLSTSMQNMAGLLVPLWVVATLQPSAFVIGIILGARNFLPTLLSIHGGAMMDHLGAKRVMMVFAVVGVIVHLIFPMADWVWAVILLQMLGGLATTMSWVGTQTLIGQIMKGDAIHSGRLSSAALIGNLTVPPIIGAAWDHLGAWGGFLTMALWSAGVFVAALILPAPSKELARAGDRIRARDFIPRLSSYVEAFAMLAVPVIALVVMISVLRNTTYAVRGSFYVVYLESINLTGTEIGFLMSAAGLFGAGAALLAGRLAKIVKPLILLFITVAGTIVFISIPPLFDTYWVLMIVAGVWGASAGMSMPLMLSILSQAADAQSQGKGVGVRITANRMASTVLPVIMGAVADASGIGGSFLIIGAAMIFALGGIALFARRVAGA